MIEKAKNPISGAEADLSQEEIITLAQIAKARKGDTRAYQALMDSGYGAPKQQVEHSAEDTVSISLNIKPNGGNSPDKIPATPDNP